MIPTDGNDDSAGLHSYRSRKMATFASKSRLSVRLNLHTVEEFPGFGVILVGNDELHPVDNDHGRLQAGRVIHENCGFETVLLQNRGEHFGFGAIGKDLEGFQGGYLLAVQGSPGSGGKLRG